MSFPKKTNNPNPSPIGNKFGLFLFGPSSESRTHGLLNPIVLLAKTQWTPRYHLYAVSSNFKLILSFCFVRCQDVSFLLWSNCGQTPRTNDLSPPAKLHREIPIFQNRDCAFLFARIIHKEDLSTMSMNHRCFLSLTERKKRKILIPTWVYSCCVRHEENRSENCRIVFSQMGVSRMGYGYCNMIYGQIRQKSLIFFVYL